MRTALCVLAAATALLLSYGSPQADESYAALVAKKAAILEDLHKRISSSLVTVAQDRAFGEYFVVQDPARRAELKQRIDEISLKTQDKFRVEEMCLIDSSGAEVSRIVGSVVAYDLAPDETGAVFFAPGFAQPNRQVYVSPPYVSPDAPKWVIGYATPIIVDGATQAVLHFEHGLDVFQRVLSAQSLPGGSYMQAVTDNGRVIFDSRHEIDIEKKGDSEFSGRLFCRVFIGRTGTCRFAEPIRRRQCGGRRNRTERRPLGVRLPASRDLDLDRGRLATVILRSWSGSADRQWGSVQKRYGFSWWQASRRCSCFPLQPMTPPAAL